MIEEHKGREKEEEKDREEKRRKNIQTEED